MNVLDSLPMATGAAWFTRQPVTPAECMRLALGVTALTLAAWGLRQMRTASAARDRQLDTQTGMLASQTEVPGGAGAHARRTDGGADAQP